MAESTPTSGAKTWTQDGVDVHVKYEFEVSSQLLQKGLEAYQPHIEVDLFYHAPKFSMTGGTFADITTTTSLVDAEERRKAVLEAAATNANKVATDALEALIVAAKVNEARRS